MFSRNYTQRVRESDNLNYANVDCAAVVCRYRQWGEDCGCRGPPIEGAASNQWAGLGCPMIYCGYRVKGWSCHCAGEPCAECQNTGLLNGIACKCTQANSSGWKNDDSQKWAKKSFTLDEMWRVKPGVNGSIWRSSSSAWRSGKMTEEEKEAKKKRNDKLAHALAVWSKRPDHMATDGDWLRLFGENLFH